MSGYLWKALVILFLVGASLGMWRLENDAAESNGLEADPTKVAFGLDVDPAGWSQLDRFA